MSRTEPSLWILGRGGLLGQALTRAADSVALRHPPIDWTADDAPTVLSDLAADFARSGDGWNVVWAAGAGVIGTEPSELAREQRGLAAVLAGLASSGTSGAFLLASSAGGVYGGNTDIPITESSSPCPISPYGHNKLEQEGVVRAWAEATSNRGVIARIANLYGPGQRLGKAQGLVTQICRSTITRQPLSIYVSLDTIRDYLFVDDCSAMLHGMLEMADGLAPGDTATKIVATGQPVSIGSLLGEARRVLGRPPNIIMTRSQRTLQQGSTLSFRSEVWPQLDERTVTPLPVGIHRTAEDLRRRIGIGDLQ